MSEHAQLVITIAEYCGLGVVGIVVALAILFIVGSVFVSGHESDLEHSRKWRAF